MEYNVQLAYCKYKTMIPNLSKLTVSTGMSRLEPVYNEGNDSERDSDREWMANVLQEHSEYLVVPLFMDTLTCVVRYGDDGNGGHNEIPVALSYEGHSTSKLSGEYVTTEIAFSFEMEKGGLPLGGVIWEIYFPQLGLGPGWSEDVGGREMKPHEESQYIKMPDEEGYDSEEENQKCLRPKQAWEALKDDPDEQNVARGADSCYFNLGVRKLQKMSSRPNMPPDGYNSDGFANSSILYADHFHELNASTQVLLDDESRQKRYDADDADDDFRDRGEWPKDLSLKGELKNIRLHLEFRHLPFSHLPLTVTGKRPRS